MVTGIGIGISTVFPKSAPGGGGGGPYEISWMVQAGGGGGGQSTGGGRFAGGAGAGGFRSSVTSSGGGTAAEPAVEGHEGDVITIVVGGASSMNANGNLSSMTSTDGNFTAISCTGGGGGGGTSSPRAGGCGGGTISTSSPGAGTPGQGMDGGVADGAGTYAGGGGGGTAVTGSQSSPFGNGGNGTITTIITPTIATTQNVGEANAGNVYFGGGGGGYDQIDNTPVIGLGGGASLHGGAIARDALINSGGGGAAGDGNPRPQVPGASGVVILRMDSSNYTGTVSGSPTVLDEGSDKILIFKGSGSYTA